MKPIPPRKRCHDRKPKPTNNAEVVRLLKQVLRKVDHVLKKEERLLKKAEKILMNQAELAQALTDASTQIQKGIDEVIAAIGNAGNVTPEVQAALDNLKSKAQALDDIVPDQP